MRSLPRLLVPAAAALVLVGCTPAAPAPEPSSPVAVAPTPDPDEVEAAVRDLHERYLAVADEVARGRYDDTAVATVLSGKAIDSMVAYRDYVATTPAEVEGSIKSAGVRVESATDDDLLRVVFLACDDWSGVVITPVGREARSSPRLIVTRMTAVGDKLSQLKIAEVETSDAEDVCA